MDIYLKIEATSLQNVNLNTMAIIPLEPVLKSVASSRTVKYIECPAFTDYYKNCFLVRAPYDIKIEAKKTPDNVKYFNIKDKDQDFCNKYILDRNNQNSLFSMISLEYSYLFYSEKSVMIELIPAGLHFHESEHLKNTMLIQGTFDISKWYRGIGYAFEIIDDNIPINIKRGDPVFYVRFLTNEKVNIVYEHENNYVDHLSSACAGFKNFTMNNTMIKNYEIASYMIKKLKSKIFKKSKCPFAFLHKK